MLIILIYPCTDNYIHTDDMAAPAQQQYSAYVDPSNPDDVVLSVPINDYQFDEDDEGKADNYNYDIIEYNEKHNTHNNGNAVAVNVDANEQDDDDFNERPKVQPAGIGIPPPPKTNDKKAKPRRKSMNNGNHNNGNKRASLREREYDLLSQATDSVFSNESLQMNGVEHPPKQDNITNDFNDWLEQLPGSDEALLSKENNKDDNPWQGFQD